MKLKIIIFLFIFMGCKKGEEDPLLSFRSRDARITGKWWISNYYYYNETNIHQTLSWDNPSCDNTLLGKSFDETDNNKTNFSSEYTVVNFINNFSTSRATYQGYSSVEQIKARNFTDQAYFYQTFDINKEGNYNTDIKLIYNNKNYPLGLASDGNMQFGTILKKTFTYSGTWNWVKNTKKKTAIEFQNFPLPVFYFKYVFNSNNQFDYRYVDSISFINNNIVFDIIKLKNNEVKLQYTQTKNSSETIITNQYEDYDFASLSWVECKGNIFSENKNTISISIELTKN